MSAKFRGILFGLLGLILIVTGIFAVVELYRRSAGASAAQAQPAILMNKVVVATHDIPLGTLLSQDDVIQVEMPAQAVPPNTLSRVEDAINRYVKADLAPGEMIMVHHLADPTNVNQELAYILADDHVMFAFPATDLLSQQNIVKRGDIVDILATLPEEIKVLGATGELETVTNLYTFDAMQDIEVTALVLEVIMDESSQTNITPTESTPVPNTAIKSYLFALNPQDALLLKHLKDADAVFDIVLRAPTSTSVFDLDPVTAEYVMELYGLI